MNVDTLNVETPCIEDVEHEGSGRIGQSVHEWMDRLGRKLIEHYGEDFRPVLNKARAEHDLLPL
jgi:hypothetical protein